MRISKWASDMHLNAYTQCQNAFFESIHINTVGYVLSINVTYTVGYENACVTAYWIRALGLKVTAA